MPTEEDIRTERNARLLNSDWTQLPDSSCNKELWQLYRQQLRDITLQEGFPDNVTYPTEPE